MMKNICIIGSGSWGVALGVHLAKLGNNVKIWSFLEEERDLINNEKKCKFLPNITLPEGIYCTTSYEEAISSSEIILHVTPSKFTRNIVKGYKEYVTNQPIVICTKGFEKETLSTLDDVISEEIPNAKIAALSGPSHAEEVSIGVPTAIVVASKDINLANEIRDIFMNETLRVYTSTDLKGVELGGALKNIIAFCAGISAGIGLGDNTFAALITRGLHEISLLGEVLGGNKQTFYGLTGLGDLIVTCLSEHSRNRRAGKLLGQGKNIEEIRKEIGMVIEGVDNIEVAYELSKKYNLDMPIVKGVYQVLYEGLDPKIGVKMLMTRDKKEE
ncbi:MAG: NAD(P)-dependent glycerol-3-phosphate dehydrogenase [Clostridia bacterium]|nr:NAD(P)-dependent glycerol-3-phosphate dehydrogenase [Clostridia bacterium]